MLDEKSSVFKWSSKSANTKYRRPNREQRPALPCRCPRAPFCPVDSRYLSRISTLPGTDSQNPGGRKTLSNTKTLSTRCLFGLPSLKAQIQFASESAEFASSRSRLFIFRCRLSDRHRFVLLLLLLRFSGGGKTKSSLYRADRLE